LNSSPPTYASPIAHRRVLPHPTPQYELVRRCGSWPPVCAERKLILNSSGGRVNLMSEGNQQVDFIFSNAYQQLNRLPDKILRTLSFELDDQLSH
jgi:hypothetical protein